MVQSISIPSDKVKGIQRRALIYFICGNPGLIEYYTDFLTNLHGLLKTIEDSTAYDIYGKNLLGFSDDEHEPFGPGNDPWDLDGQVEGIYDDVAACNGGKAYDSVVLIGHSVGAYIAVEIFHRHMKKPDRAPGLNLQHGFLLFPALTHLAKSPSGTRFEFLRRNIPVFDDTAHVGAQLILKLFSQTALQWIITKFLGFTAHTAAVTAQWLKSRDGVRQAIHLGISELETIREDTWEEELWEIAEEHDDGSDLPKFWMFYGQDDHWVADRMRDEFVERRREHGERGGRTRVHVDESGLPHAFCTREGELSTCLMFEDRTNAV